MRDSPPYLYIKQGRVWVQRQEMSEYVLYENKGMTNVNWPAAAPTQIRAQSNLSRAGSVTIDVTQGDKELATFTIPGFTAESKNALLALEDEYVQVQLHTGPSGSPHDYTGSKYGLGWVFALRQTGTSGEVARADNSGEGIPVPLEVPFAAVLGPIPIDWDAQLARVTVTDDQVANDIFTLPPIKTKEYYRQCLPGQVGMIVHDSAVGPALAGIYYFTDGMRTTPTAVATDPLAAGVGAKSVVGFGDKYSNRFIVSAETQAGVGPEIYYTDDFGTTWTAAGYLVGGATNADEVTQLWIIHSGRIYGVGGQAASSKLWHSEDQGANWTEVDPGLSQPLYDIEVLGDGTGYCVGASNVIAKITNFDGVAAITGPAGGAGDDLLCVAIKPTTGTVFIGNNAGELYYSDDGGNNWTTATTFIQGITPTSVDNMQFDASGEYGFMTCTTAADVITLRTTDGGASWRRYNMGNPVSNQAKNGLHVYGPNNCFTCGAVSTTTVVEELKTDFDGQRQL